MRLATELFVCRQLIRECLRGRCRIHIAGDLHFYLRHSLVTSQHLPPRPSESRVEPKSRVKTGAKMATLNKIVSEQRIGGESMDENDTLEDLVRSWVQFSKVATVRDFMCARSEHSSLGLRESGWKMLELSTWLWWNGSFRRSMLECMLLSGISCRASSRYCTYLPGPWTFDRQWFGWCISASHSHFLRVENQCENGHR